MCKNPDRVRGGTIWRILSAAVAPISLASSLPAQNRSSAFPTQPTVGASGKKPVTPSSTTSAPATSVATTGRPHNMASITAKGKPSIREGMTSTWFSDQISSTSATWPSNTARSASPRRCAQRSRPLRFSPSPYKCNRQLRVAHAGPASTSKIISWPLPGGSNLPTTRQTQFAVSSHGRPAQERRRVKIKKS